jgi:hypothetical protein
MRKKGHQDKCHCGGAGECGHIATERNRYFTGKYMAARDFQDEQSYFLSRHRLHNRLLHGWGIVCGLKVTPHPNPDCARRWVVVHPGIALDCCGRELILPCEQAFELPLPRHEGEGGESPPPEEYEQAGGRRRHHQPGEGGPGDAGAEDEGPNNPDADEPGPGHGGADDGVMREPFLLALRYVEDEVERVPALYHEGACDPSRTEANRVRERAELVVVALDEVAGDCWRTREGAADAQCRDDCADDLYGVGGSCLDPVCPCKEYVPLALIRFDPDLPDTWVEIDLSGRRYLPTPPELLTHIVDINWPHGGEVTLAQLNDEMGGRLEVSFDRKLQPAEGEATGVNPFTFIVQYGGVQQDLEFLPYAEDGRPDLEDDCRAVYHIDPDYINAERPVDRKQYDRHSILGSVVYVTLKCDFVLDCHGNPVDGDFLRGLLPTGDGVPGGVFESWFRVVYEREEEERWQQQRGA